MFHSFRTGLMVALFALVLVPFAGAWAAAEKDKAAAAPATGAVGTIGVVDQDKIEQSYKGFANAKDHLQAFSEERQKTFQTLQAGLGLSKDDFDDYQLRSSGTVKNDPDRIKALTDLAKKNSDAYEALKAKDKDKLTDAEKKQLDAMETNMKTVQGIIQGQGEKFSQQIQDEVARYSKTLNKLVNDSIGDVAKKQKLSIVLSKTLVTREGEATFVLWGGSDITSDVIKQLNDNFKPAMLDGTPAPSAAPAPSKTK